MSDHYDILMDTQYGILGTNLAEVGTDCISRQDALEAFGLSEKTRKYGGDHSGYDTMMMYEIQDTIEDLPPIQPKRGKWHYSDGKPARIGLSFGVVCDQCGTESEYCTNFCGECGADMRGEQDE